MKKEITIPVGSICGGIIMGTTGLCTSIAVDEAIKGTDMNKHVKEIGRVGISVIISMTFTGLTLAAIAAAGGMFNIKIGGKKKDHEISDDLDLDVQKDPARPKDLDRMNKALNLWESIIKEVSDAKIYFDEHIDSDIDISDKKFINIDNIEEFNHIMKKLSKRIGFNYNKISINEDIMILIDNISEEMDNIKESLSIIYKYCYNHDVPDYEYDDHLCDDIAEELDADESGREIATEIFNIFNGSDVDLSVEKFSELINRIDDPKITDIVEKFYNGKITIMEARDRLTAYITGTPDIDTEIAGDMDAAVLNQDNKDESDDENKSKEKSKKSK